MRSHFPGVGFLGASVPLSYGGRKRLVGTTNWDDWESEGRPVEAGKVGAAGKSGCSGCFLHRHLPPRQPHPLPVSRKNRRCS